MQTQSGELEGDESILEGLTEPQRRAARHPGGPLLVLAGAGSGKTRVITHRVAYLASAGVDSDRIMAITFTNKAADEMRRRVEAMAGERVFVSTFHSFCAQLLRREIDEMGRESTFSIYDRSDSQSAVRRVIKDLDLEPKVYSPSDMLSRISRLKNDLVDPDEWREEAVGIKDRKLADIYEGYQEVLRENNALDFDDLLVEAVRLFREHPQVLRRYQERCEHLLVDEYQDTNLPQHLLARALQGKHKNITAVGDPDQMIYSWRGARLENILEFENDFPNSTIIKLERNYRSTSNILKAASVCIRNNLRRQDKTLWTDREDGEPVQLRELENSYREGDFVAGKVKEFIDAGVDPGEIAVFYRTKHQSLPLEHGFSSLAIPHQVVDSVGFFDRKAVKDIRAYLQLLLNPDDDEACRRIINTPSRGIGDKTLERLSNAAARRDLSLARAACRVHELDLPTRATKAVAGFAELYKELNSTEYDSVTALIEDIMNKTEYVESQPADEQDDTYQVLDNLLGYAEEHDRNHPDGTLRDFLEQAALVTDVDGWNAEAEAVPLLTLHSAKGLEFDVVFVTGLEDDLLPHSRSVKGEDESEDLDALEEERRLFHVGMTRAREQLFLTYCRRRYQHGEEKHMQPSRFLDELPDDCVETGVTRNEPEEASGPGFADEMDRVVEARRRAKERRAEEKKQSVPDDAELEPGQRVDHPMFGEGTVLDISESGEMHRLRIDFDTEGEMTLMVPRGDLESSSLGAASG